MADINLVMTNWKIPITTPPVYLGESGENNAILLSIEIDSIIEADDVKYYLDICDKIEGETPTAISQEMELVDSEDTSGVATYYLQMYPTATWLGKECLKSLQVRCTYTDVTVDEETSETTETPIVLKSNRFYGIVGHGIVAYSASSSSSSSSTSA